MFNVLRRRAVWTGAAVTALLACAVGTATAAIAPPNLLPVTVPGCVNDCVVDITVRLPGNASLVAMHKEGRFEGILAYWVDGRLASYLTESGTGAPIGDQAQGAECAGTADTEQCIVTWAVGAHGSIATLASLTPADGIQVTDVAHNDSPDMTFADLNGDGVADLVMRGNDYQPDYADGALFWETALVQHNRFVITGCTTPTHDNPGPAPIQPVTGACPTG